MNMCECKKSKNKKIKRFNINAEVSVEIPLELRNFLAQKAKDKGSLIVMLHKVQNHFGYVPEKVAMLIAQMLNMTLAKVYGVITFYHYFKLKKPGDNKIQVCMGTACYLKGANDLVSEFKNILGIDLNGTTSDGKFSLETVRCIGCCGLAPVVAIGDDVYGNLKKEDLPQILEKYSQKKRRDYAEV